MMKIKYDPEKTILQCNKCNEEVIEWYNDQPEDPCPSCDGVLKRIIKTL